MQKVLITGANGFLGTHLVQTFLDQNFEVSIIVRPHVKNFLFETKNVKIHYGYIDQLQDVMNAVEGHDIVIHAASITEQFKISHEQYEAINITATKYIVEACKKHKVAKLIYISTANTIAPGNKHAPGTELNGFSLFKAKSGYINSKYVAQQYVLEQVIQHQLPAVILNPTFMIGAKDAKPSSGQLILYGLKKRVIFYPSGGKNFVYITDVCNATLNAISHGVYGEKYLVAGENLTYRDFFKKVNDAAQQKTIMIRIPKIFLTLAGSIGSFLQLMLRKSFKLNRSTAYMLCLENYYLGHKAAQTLKIKYHSTDLAVQEAHQWFVHNKYI